MCAAPVARLLNALAPTGLRHILRAHGWRSSPVGAGGDDDDDFGFFSRQKRSKGRNAEFPKVPSDAGTELMGSGDFGDNSHYTDELLKRKKSLATKLMWRELGFDAAGVRRRTTRSISQVSGPWHLPRYCTDRVRT